MFFFRTDRHVEKDMTVNGYKIPKNAEIMIPIHAIHRDPEFWEEPDKFDPERLVKAMNNIVNIPKYRKIKESKF